MVYKYNKQYCVIIFNIAVCCVYVMVELLWKWLLCSKIGEEHLFTYNTIHCIPVYTTSLLSPLRGQDAFYNFLNWMMWCDDVDVMYDVIKSSNKKIKWNDQWPQQEWGKKNTRNCIYT